MTEDYRGNLLKSGAMTLGQLIEELEKVKDKTAPVMADWLGIRFVEEDEEDGICELTW